MSKNMIIGIVVATVVLGGGFALVNNQANNKNASETAMVKDDAMMQKDDAAMEKDATSEHDAMEKKEGEAMMEKDGDKMMKSDSSRYVEYSKTVLDQSADKRRVLYFYATWCPSCKAGNEDLTANAHKIPEDVVVIRTNYNDPETDAEEKALAQKYGITYQHTFVQIDGQGKEVTKWNGGKTEDLLANLK